MRILHVLATLDPASGGPAAAALGMAGAVAARGHTVDAYATDYAVAGGSITPDSVQADSRVGIRLFGVAPPRFWKPSWSMARALVRDIPTYDVVHVHALYLFHDLVAGMACRRSGVPYVVCPHGLLDPYILRHHRWRKALVGALFQNGMLRHADAIHYTATDEQELARPASFGVPGAVIPLGIDTGWAGTLPPRNALQARYPELAGKCVVLFMGRLHRKKGLDLLVPALAQARRQRPDLHLLLAGPDDGMLHAALSAIRDQGLTGAVTVTGMLTGHDKLAALSAADMFVLPSYSENFAIAAAEAMAAGLPVIVSDRVNIHSDIAAARAGLVVPCDAGRLTAAILQLARSTDRSEMGECGKTLVSSRYSWETIGKQLEDLYSLVAMRTAPPETVADRRYDA